MLDHVNQGNYTQVEQSAPVVATVTAHLRVTPIGRAQALLERMGNNPSFRDYQENITHLREQLNEQQLQVQLAWLYHQIVIPVEDLDIQLELKEILLTFFEGNELQFACFQKKFMQGMQACLTNRGAEAILQEDARRNLNHQALNTRLEGRFLNYMRLDERRCTQLQEALDKEKKVSRQVNETLKNSKEELDELTRQRAG